MSEIKVTRKDLFARIAETMSEDAEVVAMCEKYIAQLSRKRPAKVKPEVEEFRGVVKGILENQEEAVTNKQMCEFYRVEHGEVSAQKMAAALRWLVANGLATCQEPETKNGVKTYLAAELPNVVEW